MLERDPQRGNHVHGDLGCERATQIMAETLKVRWHQHALMSASATTPRTTAAVALFEWWCWRPFVISLSNNMCHDVCLAILTKEIRNISRSLR